MERKNLKRFGTRRVLSSFSSRWKHSFLSSSSLICILLWWPTFPIIPLNISSFPLQSGEEKNLNHCCHLEQFSIPVKTSPYIFHDGKGLSDDRCSIQFILFGFKAYSLELNSGKFLRIYFFPVGGMRGQFAQRFALSAFQPSSPNCHSVSPLSPKSHPTVSHL